MSGMLKATRILNSLNQGQEVEKSNTPKAETSRGKQLQRSSCAENRTWPQDFCPHGDKVKVLLRHLL